MKNLLLATLLFGISSASYPQGWSLVWEDDFSGTTLDQSKWTHDLGTGSQYGLWGWGNGELQFYQAGNTEVSNGTLKIVAKEEPGGVVDSYSAERPLRIALGLGLDGGLDVTTERTYPDRPFHPLAPF